MKLQDLPAPMVAAIARQSEARREPVGRYHVTEVLYCPVKAQLTRLALECRRFDDKKVRNLSWSLFRGQLFHSVFQPIMGEGVKLEHTWTHPNGDEITLVGEADWIERDDNGVSVLGELKTVKNRWWYEKNGAGPEHQLQVAAYLWMCNKTQPITNAAFYYLDMDGIVRIPIKYDVSELEETFNAFKDSAEKMHTALTTHTLPDRRLNWKKSWECNPKFCLAPGTPILTADFHWIPIETLKPEDKLIGFDEWTENGKEKAGRYYHISTIKNIWARKADCYQFKLDDGRNVICSSEHPWLVKNSYDNKHTSRYYWKETKWIFPGTFIMNFGIPWTIKNDFIRGQMSGLYDGEGSINSKGHEIMIAQNDGLIWDFIIKTLKEEGFIHHPYKYGNTNQFRISGAHNVFKVLGLYQPMRLIKNYKWDGKAIKSKISLPSAKVISIEPVGIKDVYGIETDIHTYIANGLASHNCPFTEFCHPDYPFEPPADKPNLKEWYAGPMKVAGEDIAENLLPVQTVMSILEETGVKCDWRKHDAPG